MCHKTQKFPAFEAGDDLFQGYFAWFSSIGSHKGQPYQRINGWSLFIWGFFRAILRLSVPALALSVSIS